MFQTTLWSRIEEAQRGDSLAVDQLVVRYRPPILAYARSKGYSAEDAEDLAQEVLLRLFTRNTLAKADRERGRFRAYLLGVSRNVIREQRERASALKRGGGDAHVPLSLAPEVAAAEPDPGFDRIWVEQLLARALEGLKAENERQHQTLILRFQEGASPTQIAERLGRNLQQVNNDVHRARKRLARLVKAEIASYASSKDEYEDDLALFLGQVGL